MMMMMMMRMMMMMWTVEVDDDFKDINTNDVVRNSKTKNSSGYDHDDNDK